MNASGNVIVVGAPNVNNDRGSAHVFSRTTEGNWTQDAEFVPSNATGAGVLSGSAVGFTSDTSSTSNEVVLSSTTATEPSSSWVHVFGLSVPQDDEVAAEIATAEASAAAASVALGAAIAGAVVASVAGGIAGGGNDGSICAIGIFWFCWAGLTTS